ncbi:MAG: discoidin domain-containing protein [Alphaproteobacteria bacterium]|nr:discoidin domain-containing protein [Alphaproteobacteria bacterium]MCB9796638.1 discoidin domain-containing protein [Alphaproteobacteria bacterium]
MNKWLPTLAALAGLSVTSFAFAGFVKVGSTSVTASSELPPDDGGNYYARNAVDHKVSSVWVEGDTEGSGLGSTLKFEFGGPKKVETIRLWNGNWYSYDFWERHNRVKDLEIRFPDGEKQTVTLKDERVVEDIKVESPKPVEWIELRVKSIYRGTTFNDTVVSEVVFIDDAADEGIEVASYKASSTYPEDADGSYEPKKMADTLLDTMWCENNKSGDGTGEWLEFDFGKSVSVSKLQMVNGNGYSPAYCLKANRATKGTLTFSDGSSQSIDIKTLCLPQTIDFPATTTSKVRLTFDEVKAGSEFNDLCISEAAFLP